MARLSILLILGLWCLERTNAFSTIGTSFPLLQISALSASTTSYGESQNIDSTHRIYQQRREFLTRSIATSSYVLLPFLVTQPAFADDDAKIDPSTDLPKITQKVYLDIKFGNARLTGGKPRKLVIGLFGDAMPKAVENFLTLCTNADGPSYNGATFYRALSGMSIQGGAIGSNTSGKTGTTAFDGGKPFAPDNFNILHSKAGLVSAVRGLDGDIDSRFFIQTENDAGWADDRYAAFGIVLDDYEEGGSGGMDLVRRISKVEVTRPKNTPKDPVMIVGCGVLEG